MIWCGSGSTTRGVDREHGVEQVREADAVRLGDQAEERAVAVEAPGPALLDDLEARLVVAVEQLVGDLAGGGLVGELQRLGAEPLDADDGDQRVGQDAADGGVGLELFESCSWQYPSSGVMGYIGHLAGISCGPGAADRPLAWRGILWSMVVPRPDWRQPGSGRGLPTV